jgi:hypothetical protein
MAIEKLGSTQSGFSGTYSLGKAGGRGVKISHHEDKSWGPFDGTYGPVVPIT